MRAALAVLLLVACSGTPPATGGGGGGSAAGGGASAGGGTSSAGGGSASTGGGSSLGGGTAAGGGTSAGGGTASMGGGSSSTGGGTADAGDPSSFELFLGPTQLNPGEERTLCLNQRLGNLGTYRVDHVKTGLPPTTSELVVYRVNDTVAMTTPVDCEPLAGLRTNDGGVAVAYSKLAGEDLQLPAGTAFTFAPNQMVRMELHAINLSNMAFPVSATVTVSAATVPYQQEAGLLVADLRDIQIPVGGSPVMQTGPVAVPPDFEGTAAFNLTGYTHALGVDMYAEFGMAEVYGPPVWMPDNPPIVTPQPALAIPTDGGVVVNCVWQNNGGNPAAYGPSFRDERCDLRVYYSPAQPEQFCMRSNMMNLTICCPGPGC